MGKLFDVCDKTTCATTEDLFTIFRGVNPNPQLTGDVQYLLPGGRDKGSERKMALVVE